ncbi:MAG: hypothetical protein M3Q10_09275 [Chloroflexota bacterium]|nr:hypothetical protein [Chloroflexota bacterium]
MSATAGELALDWVEREAPTQGPLYEAWQAAERVESLARTEGRPCCHCGSIDLDPAMRLCGVALCGGCVALWGEELAR